MASPKPRDQRAYDAARYDGLKSDPAFKAGRAAYAKTRMSADSGDLHRKNAEAQRRWRRAHPDEHRRRKRVRYQALRAAVLKFLGGVCRCGFSDPRALQIDHVHGGGTRVMRSTVHETFYRSILRGERSGLVRLLCATCNWRERLRLKKPAKFPKATYLVLRKRVVAHLGARCECGESDIDVLHIDHVHGGGSIERRATKLRADYYRAMLTAAPGTHQLLCPNCNWIKKHDNASESSSPQRLASVG